MGRKAGTGAPKSSRTASSATTSATATSRGRSVHREPLSVKVDWWFRSAHILITTATLALSLKDMHLRGAGVCAFSLFLALWAAYLQRIQGAAWLRTLLSLCETIALVVVLGLLAVRSTMLDYPQRLAFLDRFSDFPESCVHKSSCTRLAPANPHRAQNLRVPVLHASAQEIYAATVDFIANTKHRVHYRVEKEPHYLHAEILTPYIGHADSLAVQVFCDPEDSGFAQVWIHAEGNADTSDYRTNYIRVRKLVKHLGILDQDPEAFLGRCTVEKALETLKEEDTTESDLIEEAHTKESDLREL